MIAHVKERLASYKAPRRVRVVTTIGRAPNGKVDYKRHRAESMDELGVARLGLSCRGLRQTGCMFIAPADATRGEGEWRSFVESHPFGHLVAPGGPARDLPVVVPTQFVLEGGTVWLHLVRANPVFAALAENPRVLLSVADDWAFIPSSWKAIGDEDPALGIPTTYYGAVQLAGTATVHDERTHPGSVAAILRRQLAAFQPDVAVADPAESHAAKLPGILGIEDRASSTSRPSSSTEATSTSRTAGPWWTACASGAVRATTPRPTTSCGGWRAERPAARPPGGALRGYSTAAARLASVAAISCSACAALWSPMTRATVTNHGLRWSSHDSVTRQPASVSSNS